MFYHVRRPWVFGLGSLAVVAMTAAVLTAIPSRADDAAASNMVEQYQQQLDNGTARLAYADSKHGYLPDLLKAFRVSRESQLLVFSASSLQFDKINQQTPRALYFQDDIAIGNVHGGSLVEIIVTDRDSGVAFYTLDTAKADKPRFARRTTECVTCHIAASGWAPGLMVASYATGPGGQLLNLDPYNLFRLTDDRTPFEDRYGGWYVTGMTGAMPHRGNVTISPEDPLGLPPGGTNINDLGDRIAKSDYLEPGSDIVSLLTLEHQAGFVNLVARINAQYRSLDPKVPATRRATVEEIDGSIDELFSYVTFAQEKSLPSPVTGSGAFSRMFAEQGTKDSRGRSLRQFDLQTRLFRYPLSYMIYSQAFDNLNPTAKDRVLRRLYDSLGSRQGGAAAINIAAITKPSLPAYWKPVPE